MLDSDISTRDAVARLSIVDDDPAGWSRRRFLQAIAGGVAGGATLAALDAAGLPSLLPNRLRDAWAGTAIGPRDGVLVVVGMYGGIDLLNTLVPFASGRYYDLRTTLSIPAHQVLRINGQVGFAPELRFLKSLYDRGEVAVVQGVGYPNPDLSHFSSMALWMAGKASGVPSSGWLGRWLDGRGSTDIFQAASIGSTVPLAVLGNVRRATGVPNRQGLFGASREPYEVRMYEGLRRVADGPSGRGAWQDAVAASIRTQLDVVQRVDPLLGGLDGAEIVRSMTVAARLVNADLGLRVVHVGWGDFDSHSRQADMLPLRLSEFDTALRAFYTNLSDRFRSRVAILTYSEFGRQPERNGSAGTDHGTAGLQLVIGDAVRGGLHGQYPSLTDLIDGRQMRHQVDYRSVYATVIDRWLGGGSRDVIGADFPPLDLFAAGPGAGVPTSPPPPNLAGDFVPLAPFRLLDTRVGTGGRITPLGPGTVVDIDVLGRGGVPASGVTAVALNITATQPSATTWFTVWPGGEAPPYASNLNMVRGQTVPNMVVVKVGAGGKVHLRNQAGEVHAIADVVGYFRQTAATRLVPLSPARILDTREGNGARRGRLGQEQVIELQVAGRGGVPANGADAVVMNVTVTEPDSDSWLTIWPTGSARPNASSLNYRPGLTVPNLVVAKLGSGGRVSLFNARGSAHVIADVVGCFASGGRSRHTPVAPSRILDTRDGTGGVRGPVGNGPFDLQVTGRAGVPTSATAVALNVTVTEPTAWSWLTVWPTGEPLPTASSLNYDVGATVANMVVAKLGAGGRVRIQNAHGAAQVIADVVGFFTG